MPCLTHPPLVVRDLLPGETEPIHALFTGLSERSRLLRFHGPVPRLTRTMLERLADVDPHRHHAHLGTLEGRPVGVARWTRDPHRPHEAELAVEVVDDLQGTGLGTALASAAARSAEAAGIATFVAHVLPVNRPGRSWARSLGARCTDPHDPDRFTVAVATVAALAPARPGTAACEHRVPAEAHGFLRRWRRNHPLPQSLSHPATPPGTHRLAHRIAARVSPRRFSR